MQQRGCEKVQLLLSKYADNEASPSERERVYSHVATCETCAGRLAEYKEVSAMFSSEPRRAAEPQLRAGVFQEIHRLNEEEQRRQRQAEASRPWYLPARPLYGRGRRYAPARPGWGNGPLHWATTNRAQQAAPLHLAGVAHS